MLLNLSLIPAKQAYLENENKQEIYYCAILFIYLVFLKKY
jgi:hypothetical protein